MDTITHTVLGACTGELIAGKKLGKKAMLFGALVNNLPDIDMVANFWTSETAALLSHRGITHSFIFAACIIPLLVLLFRRKHSTLSTRGWSLLIGHGLIIHILLDSCTTYGTGLFEPFSQKRISFNTLFILDPTFTIPMLLGAVILLILNRHHRARPAISKVALGLSSLYLMVSIIIKVLVTETIKDEIARQHLQVKNFSSSPTPLNNLMYYVILKDSLNFHVAFYSILDDERKINFTPIDRNDSLLKDIREVEEVSNLIRFSKDYYSLRKTEKGILFSDMRFGQTGLTNLEKAPFVFNFDIVKQDSKIKVSQAEFAPLTKKDISQLYQRIKGIKSTDL